MNEAREIYQKLSDPTISKNQNCQAIGGMLGISGKYFLQIMNGTRYPSKPLTRRIMRLYQKHDQKHQKPTRKRHYRPTVTIRVDSEEQKERLQSLTNKQRIAALENWINLHKNR